MNGTGSYTKSWAVRIIIINVAVFLVQLLLTEMYDANTGMRLSDTAIKYFGVRPDLVIHKYYVWQLFTYMFLHGGFLHILLNMYFLFALGMPVEHAWGGKKFLMFYLFTGIGAGFTICIVNYIMGDIIPTIGASGAIYGVIVAFGMLFPEVELYFFFVPVPIKAKYLVLFYGAINIVPFILQNVTSSGKADISYIGHLGGILFGFLFFFILRRRGISFKSKLIKARLSREIVRRNNELDKNAGLNESTLQKILLKLKESGPDSITDDEFQYIRYMEIMKQDSEDLCQEEKFNPEGPDCKKCADADACLLRQIKK
jgi:membrane associated rhomboid family serine protease